MAVAIDLTGKARPNLEGWASEGGTIADQDVGLSWFDEFQSVSGVFEE